MKTLFTLLFTFTLLSACQQLLHGQQQPVRTKPNGDYLVGCGGAVETWGSCNDKAMNTCPKGYDAVNKVEDTTGILRELTFRCRK